MIRHLVLSRMAYTRNYPIAANRRRLEFTRRVTVPSLGAQTERRFTWVVRLDPSDPLLEERLEVCKQADIQVFPVLMPYRGNGTIQDMPGTSEWAEPVAYLGRKASRVLTTRLDDDDAFTPDALGRIRCAGEKATHVVVLNIPQGYRVLRGVLVERSYTSNMFATLVSGRNRHIYETKHTLLREIAPIVQIDNKVGWLWTRHRDALSYASPSSQRAVEPAHGQIHLRDLFPVDWDFLTNHT